MNTNLGFVIVHYRNYPRVRDTVQDVWNSSVSGPLIVVDNSEDPGTYASLVGLVGNRGKVIACQNRGYAAAVNIGVRELSKVDFRLRYILVLTHEVRFPADAVGSLASHADSNPLIAGIGPALFDLAHPHDVWSLGGAHSRILNLPRHIRRADGRLKYGGSVASEWLDGAMVLYRAEVLLKNPMSEEYFIYFEEVDYHSRIRRMGLQVRCAVDVRAYQSSSGIPGFYLGRNMGIYQTRYGNRFQRVVSAPYAIVRTAIVNALRGNFTDVGPSWRGWIAGRRLACEHVNEEVSR